MPISAHEQAKAAMSEDIFNGRAILELSARMPQLKFLLTNRPSQANLRAIVKFLTLNRVEWTNKTNLEPGQIIGGVSRAILGMERGDVPNRFFFEYEISFYSAAERLEIDPPPPVNTPLESAT